MTTTRGRWEGGLSFTDGQIFLGASDFLPLVVAGAPIASAGAGLFTRNIPASTTANLFANINSILRTGQLANNLQNQSQFGTAALVPGPSSVAGTSGPLAVWPGFPALGASKNPTISGPQNAPIPKGIGFTSVDVIYEVDTGAITSVTVGLTQTKMPAAGATGAPVVANILALAANGLPVAANTAGQATTTRVATTSASFVILAESEVIVNVNFVTPAANTVKFYGVVLNVNFNYN